MSLTDVPKLILLPLAMALGLALLLGVRALEYSGDAAAYDASPACEPTVDVSNCRFDGAARVVRTWKDRYSHLGVALAFDQLGGQTADGDVGDRLASAWSHWRPGDQIDAELWHGSITRIAELRTDSNPHQLASSYGPSAVIFSSLAVALLAAFVAFKIVIWRRARAPVHLAPAPPAPPWQ